MTFIEEALQLPVGPLVEMAPPPALAILTWAPWDPGGPQQEEKATDISGLTGATAAARPDSPPACA